MEKGAEIMGGDMIELRKIMRVRVKGNESER